MALYKYDVILVYSQTAVFDAFHEPGAPAPHAGIYQCTACAKEAARAQGEPLPGAAHGDHQEGKDVRWRLIVRVQSDVGAIA